MQGRILNASLAHLRVSNLLQMVLSEALSARFVLRSPMGSGEIRVRQGTLVDAHFSGLSGNEAMLSLLTCHGGELDVLEDEAQGEITITADPLSLILESLRIQDHWDEFADRVFMRVSPGGPETPVVRALEEGLTVLEVAERLGMAPVHILPEIEALAESEHWVKGKRRSARIGMKELLERVMAEAHARTARAPLSVSPVPDPPSASSSLPPRATFSLLNTADTGSVGEDPARARPHVASASLVAPLTATLAAQPTSVFPVNSQPDLPGIQRGGAPALEVPQRSAEEERIEREFFRLLDEGRRAFRRNDLAEAEALWSQAQELRPEDRTLRQNLRILQLKRAHTPAP